MQVGRVLATISVVVVCSAATGGGVFLGFMFGGPLGACIGGGVGAALSMGAATALYGYFASLDRQQQIQANQALLQQLAASQASDAALRAEVASLRATAATITQSNNTIKQQREAERANKERTEAQRAKESAHLVNSQQKCVKLEQVISRAHVDVGSLREKVAEGGYSQEDTVNDLTDIEEQLVFQIDPAPTVTIQLQ